ncbi:unnamed protein product [Echinostoma caproni]|uniref:CCDC92 domain-containing protein n=1 Tax=Echinostoma caproni TaxID=27848 RepID=A0A183B0S8_9TREM|nr:unnamed protein product [Echinostoma caproni]
MRPFGVILQFLYPCSSENLRLSSERNVLVTNSTSMVLRIKELEQQCRRLRQDLENVDLREKFGNSNGLAQAILTHRNGSKEQLCELQDAIRWTGALKAEQMELQQRQMAQRSGGPRKRSRIWALFAKLFTPKNHENGSAEPQDTVHSSVIYEARADGHTDSCIISPKTVGSESEPVLREPSQPE